MEALVWLVTSALDVVETALSPDVVELDAFRLSGVTPETVDTVMLSVLIAISALAVY